MKKLLLAASLLLVIAISTASAQCWITPTDGSVANISGTESNQNFNGNTIFEGDATLNNSVNLNKFQYIVFKGTITVKSPVNLNNQSNVYIYGNVKFDQLHFEGGDTLFVNGYAEIDHVISNNSKPDSRNVIMLAENSSVKIEGTIYSAETTIATPGNAKNEIDIIKCSASALPVSFEYARISYGVLEWKVPDQIHIKDYTIQGSNNAKDWTDLGTVKADASGIYIFDLQFIKLGGIGLLFLLVLIGMLIPGKRIKAAGIGLLLIAASLGSCTKKVDSHPSDAYKLFRVQVNMTDGTVFYSKVLK